MNDSDRIQIAFSKGHNWIFISFWDETNNEVYELIRHEDKIPIFIFSLANITNMATIATFFGSSGDILIFTRNQARNIWIKLIREGFVQRITDNH